MRLPAILTAVFLTFAPQAVAQRGFLASDGHQLFRIESGTYEVELIGPMAIVSGFSEFNHGALEADITGTLFSMTKQRLYRVDPDTAQTTEVGLLSAGLEVFEGGLAFHPLTGEAYALNAGSNTNTRLLRVNTSTGQANSVGSVPPGWHDFNGLVFDKSGALFAVDRPTDALWRIDPVNPGGPGSFMVGTGLGGGIDVGDAGGLTCDPVTGELWGYDLGGQILYTVDTVTGRATVQHTYDGTVPLFFSLAIAGCPSIHSYGDGCAGTGGIVPQLDVPTCPVRTGQTALLEITGGLGGAQALVVFGAGQGFAPMDAGCALLVQPLFAPLIALPLGGTGAGNGNAVFGGLVPPGLPAPFSFTTQVFIADSGGPASFSSSQGVEVFVDA